MSSKINFLDIIEENKGNIKKIKNIITENVSLVNKEIKIYNSDSESLIYSPLTYCLEKKNSELSIFLIEKGANINYKTSPKEDYPLLIACRNGLEEVVEKLLQKDNIDINCLNKNNETVYSILVANKNISINKLIMDYIKKKSNKKEKKIHDDKRKIITKNISFDLSLQYKYRNIKFGKYIFFKL